MKGFVEWLLGADASRLGEPLTAAGIVLSAILALSALTVMTVLVVKGRLRVRSVAKKLWERTSLIFRGCITVLTNSFAVGWLTGGVYSGNLKFVCTPGLNCYSCPGAWGSCPIGALQAILNEFDPKRSHYDAAEKTFVTVPRYSFAFYAVGIIMLFGALCGRLVCGMLCPFGWIQDLVWKLPVKKLRIDPAFSSRSKHPRLAKAAIAADKYLRYLKYAVLATIVIFIPAFSASSPWFCKYVCPSGMLMGGAPLLIMNRGLAANTGALTALKASILASVLVLSAFVFRPFCRYICPLGAFYALFNPVSLYRYGVDDSACRRCEGCSACASACPMGVDPVKTPNSPECIRCGVCASSCPQKAIRPGFRSKTPEGRAIRTRKLKK